MDLKEALDKANQILNEERRNPTVTYEPVPEKDLPKDWQILGVITGRWTLQDLRAKRPRPILENPREFRFESINHDLLCALLLRLPEKERNGFVSGLLLRLLSAYGCGPTYGPSPPSSWNSLVSELPLVVEFAVRYGGKKELFNILAGLSPHPGHVIMLRHLEDMIALNYTIFTDSEYGELNLSVDNLRTIAGWHLKQYQEQNVRTVTTLEIGNYSPQAMCHEIIQSAGGITEECRKAGYLYLKGVLLEGLNLEVNQDKGTVESYLQQLGFSKSLQDCLNEADRLYQASATAFDLKSGMGHLRSFMESLHAEAIRKLVAKAATFPPSEWGPGLAFLRQNDVLSVAEEKFAAGLYGLISDQAVHPLIAQREYARLARNMVIEYALLFLRKLEKLGLVSGPEAASS